MSIHRDVKTGRFLPDPQSLELHHGIFSEDTPSSAWLAGVIAADGHVTPDLKSVSLTQSGDSGRMLIEEVRRLTNHTSGVWVSQPAKGRPAHTVRLASPQMASDLGRKYLVTPRKTLTYRWPSLPAHLVVPFLRGYVDGDGCVGIYPTPQGNPMLHLSFVGTPWSIREAMKPVPAQGRFRPIERCKALAEARYNGRHAWQAATWLFDDLELFKGSKWHIFSQYRSTLQHNPPRWYRLQGPREIAMACLAKGSTPTAAAHAAGVGVELVYTWRRKERMRDCR